MSKLRLTNFLLAGISVVIFSACSEKTIEMESPPLAEYFPMQLGKYITYRIDSTVPTAFGADTTVRSYRVRDTYDAEIKDGLDRKAYRVLRTISNLAGTAPYVPNNTFSATPVGEDWIEWYENNLRYMKMRFPMLTDFTWKGNSFIDATSLNSTVRYLADWDYVYQNIGQPYTVLGKTYPETVTIQQCDEVLPPGPFDPKVFKQYNYSVEVYAKGIGLIYKNFDHKEWQPPTDGRPGYWVDGSYRVVLQILDHN